MLVAHECHDGEEFPDELIQVILDASSGNPFWCKEIAAFIVERGQDEFMNNSKDKDLTTSLSALVICKVELLSHEQQVVLKHAAVVGEEFTMDLLQSTLPRKVSHTIHESLTVLTDFSFIVLTNEYPLTYAFPNQVIKNILYDLTPARYE